MVRVRWKGMRTHRLHTHHRRTSDGCSRIARFKDLMHAANRFTSNSHLHSSNGDRQQAGGPVHVHTPCNAHVQPVRVRREHRRLLKVVPVQLCGLVLLTQGQLRQALCVRVRGGVSAEGVKARGCVCVCKGGGTRTSVWAMFSVAGNMSGTDSRTAANTERASCSWPRSNSTIPRPFAAYTLLPRT